MGNRIMNKEAYIVCSKMKLYGCFLDEDKAYEYCVKRNYELIHFNSYLTEMLDEYEDYRDKLKYMLDNWRLLISSFDYLHIVSVKETKLF